MDVRVAYKHIYHARTYSSRRTKIKVLSPEKNRIIWKTDDHKGSTKERERGLVLTVSDYPTRGQGKKKRLSKTRKSAGNNGELETEIEQVQQFVSAVVSPSWILPFYGEP